MCVKLNHLCHQISFNIVTIDSKSFFELLTFVFKKDVILDFANEIQNIYY